MTNLDDTKPAEMKVDIDAQARASLRHFMSAAIIFGKGFGDTRHAHTRALEAFDEWFALVDSKNKSSDER